MKKSTRPQKTPRNREDESMNGAVVFRAWLELRADA
jgi:hypothetical protein